MKPAESGVLSAMRNVKPFPFQVYRKVGSAAQAVRKEPAFEQAEPPMSRHHGLGARVPTNGAMTEHDIPHQAPRPSVPDVVADHHQLQDIIHPTAALRRQEAFHPTEQNCKPIAHQGAKLRPPFSDRVADKRVMPQPTQTPIDISLESLKCSADYPPIWRKAFALSHNVRFTRTPDVELIRKRAETDPAYAKQLLAMRIKQNPQREETVPASLKPQETAQSLPVFPTQHFKTNVENNSLSIQTERDVMPVNQAEAIHIAVDEAVADQQASAPVNKPIQISDYAFFEFGPFALDGCEEIQTTTEEAEQAEGSIADLFRVLECRFSKGSVPAKVEVTPKPDDVSEKSVAHTQSPVIEEAAALNPQDDHSLEVETSSDAPIEAKPVSAAFQTMLQYPYSAAYSTTINSAPTLSYKASATQAETITECSEMKAASVAPEPLVSASEPVDTPAIEIEEAKTKDEKVIVEEKPAPQKSVAITPRHISDLQAGIVATPRMSAEAYDFPSVDLLQQPVYKDGAIISQETLERSAGLLESVLEDFGIKGEIIHVRPGPVVTLYEFEPAPGVKSSRVIGLSDDIARSMSAVSARVAVIPGRNVIGIELPNTVRETVFLREIIQSQAFETTNFKLALALGKNIGGEPIIAELAKMPHLLVAGTTGSGKSVAINTMILSLLYRMTPDQCRLIMVDPKMLELSIYDGIPHLLTPVVTDPKKAVTALKWAVREMEDRYRKMAKLGVRNIDGFNERVTEASKNGETITCTVQAGFDKETGELLYNEEAMDLSKLPYIVIVVDEMADLMMVAGKEIEGAIQRLAQMARAAGIHLIMATQRPSVDVITGTIKANFPTRISFQVTSKIDSRTILGEQGAETLLGQGDMLHMAGGGRIVRVHGAFVSDSEVEHIVSHLKTQGTPDYLATVTDSEEDEDQDDDGSNIADIVANVGDDSEELYVQAVKVVMRDKKCSTSYIQRRLGIGYNKAATLVERMEEEGLVGTANHVGKREILINGRNRHHDSGD